jgi:hypothetical protein
VYYKITIEKAIGIAGITVYYQTFMQYLNWEFCLRLVVFTFSRSWYYLQFNMNFVLAILIVILPTGSSFEPQKKCFDVAKVQLCEKFLRDEVDECLVYIKPFYNKVSLSAD